MKKSYELFTSSTITSAWAIGVTLLTMSASSLSAADIRASCSGTNLNLSWSQDATNDFYVQVSTNLADPAGWRILTNATLLAGSDYSVTDAISGPNRFYRLKAWEILFNGSSTATFRGYQQTSFPSDYWVITTNGELKTLAGSPRQHIITTNQYDDFELVWEWKTAAGGNSGVIYRALEIYPEPSQSGPEYQILDDAYAPVPANQTSGEVFSLIAPTNKVLMPTGQWNQGRLLVQNNHVEYWLNGQKVVEYELNNPAFNALVAANPHYDPYPLFAKARSGHIVFQLWTPEVSFRNIKVRRLPPE